MNKKVLISGVSGQDGAYLAKLLLTKGYEVYGTSRDAQNNNFENLKKLDIFKEVKLLSMALNDFRSVFQNISKIKPDEIYNLGGQTSVGLSFEQPVETIESIVLGNLNILESIRFSELNTKFFNACSSECFGNTKDLIITENTSFNPKSPYAIAKSTAFWQVSNYREAYNIFCCSGIMFNHESTLRPNRFVTKKIINSALNISKGLEEKLYLGNINIYRDWGYAPEYIEAMWLMLQQNKAEDFIIATGETNSLKDFIKIAFELLNLNWEDYVVTDENLFRPLEISTGIADISKAEKNLNWKASYKMREVIKAMLISNNS